PSSLASSWTRTLATFLLSRSGRQEGSDHQFLRVLIDEYSSDVHGFFYLFHVRVGSKCSRSRARCPVSTAPRNDRTKPPRRSASSRHEASGWSHAPRPGADPV